MKSEREWKSWLNAEYSENKDHGTWCHHFMANRWGNNGNSESLYFPGLQNHCKWWLQLWNENMLAPSKKNYDKPDSILKSRDITLPTKICLVKTMVFPVLCMDRESDYKESWALKNWCFWTVVLERTLERGLGVESLLDCKEIKPVNPKGN